MCDIRIWSFVIGVHGELDKGRGIIGLMAVYNNFIRGTNFWGRLQLAEVFHDFFGHHG